MHDITTVADVTALDVANGTVAYTLTETTTVTKRGTMPLDRFRALVEADGWAESEKLTGDLPIGDLRDALSDAFSAEGAAERDTHHELTVDALRVR